MNGFQGTLVLLLKRSLLWPELASLTLFQCRRKDGEKYKRNSHYDSSSPGNTGFVEAAGM